MSQKTLLPNPQLLPTPCPSNSSFQWSPVDKANDISNSLHNNQKGISNEMNSIYVTGKEPINGTSSNTEKASCLKKKRRRRKRYYEVERFYKCNYPNCTKAYGTLGHLNCHIMRKKHGKKRLPSEFKELRKRLERRKKMIQEQRAVSVERQQLMMQFCGGLPPINMIAQPQKQVPTVYPIYQQAVVYSTPPNRNSCWSPDDVPIGPGNYYYGQQRQQQQQQQQQIPLNSHCISYSPYVTPPQMVKAPPAFARTEQIVSPISGTVSYPQFYNGSQMIPTPISTTPVFKKEPTR